MNGNRDNTDDPLDTQRFMACVTYCWVMLGGMALTFAILVTLYVLFFIE